MRRVPRALDEVLKELGEFYVSELAATQVAIACLRTVAHQALETVANDNDQESVRLLGADVPDGGWVATVYGITGARSLVAEMSEGGPTHCRLTQQLLVTVYTGWDSEYRRRIAAAHGVEENAIRDDFFGDLRDLRNDIVHHRGTATRKGSARCRTIIAGRLQPGDSIYLTDDELRKMHLMFPWAVLVKRPET